MRLCLAFGSTSFTLLSQILGIYSDFNIFFAKACALVGYNVWWIYPVSLASPQCKFSGWPLGENFEPMGPGNSFFVHISVRVESVIGARTDEYRGDGQGGFSTGLEGTGRGGGGGVTGLDFSCRSDSAKKLTHVSVGAPLDLEMIPSTSS